MEEAENLLKNFGLTKYETRAYVTLLKLGIATAEQISNVGNIPLPRVYDTLVELQRKGFVLISKSRPKKFKAMLPQKALKSLIDIKKKNYDNKIKEMKNSTRNIIKILSKVQSVRTTEKRKYDLWSTERRKNITKTLDEQKKLAKKEILIFSGDMSWIKETMPTIKQTIKKGIKIRAITHEPKTDVWLKNIKLAKKIGIDIRTGYKGFMRGHIVDDKIVSIAMKQFGKELNIAGSGKPGSDILLKYELMTSDNPVLVKSLKENFEFWWNKLK